MSYTYITKFNSPNFTAKASAKAVFGQNRVIKGITIHHWGDPSTKPTFSGVVNYLCRKGGNTSAHIVATGTGRQVACIVNFPDVAWHAGNATGNATTIGIECDPRCRAEDYDVVAEVIADLRSFYGNIPLYPHKHWKATSCPGAYDLKKLDNIAAKKKAGVRFGQVTNKSTPSPAPAPAVAKPSVKPNPTPEPPMPVAERTDYDQENNALLKQILAGVNAILAIVTSVFKSK